MFFLLGILNGLGEIRAHKLRSLLTVTCVLLGVASIVLISAFITGLFHRWEIISQEMGWAQRVSVEDNQVPDDEKSLAARSPGRTLADARALERLATHADAVAPEIELRANLAFNGRPADPEVSTRGVTQGILKVDRYEVARGRFISDLDLDQADPVIVLGSAPAKQMFAGREDPIGQVVTVNSVPFRVVGLLKHYELMDGDYNTLERKNQVAFAPLTAIQRRVNGQTQLSNLQMQVDNVANVGKLIEQAKSVLRSTHRGVHDFNVYTQAESAEYINNMRRNFFLVGCGIGAITLLVGGIGIMNLMLASINERVREIGIRKAIGAWNRDIFVQFIAEAVALSALGGLLGVGVAITAVRILRHAMSGGNSSPPVLSVPAVVIGLGFSVFVGIVAGLYPAFRASRLDPIEALRYE